MPSVVCSVVPPRVSDVVLLGLAGMKVISENDPEPVFGLAASLPDPEFKLVQTKTRDWFAETVEFVDMAYIARGPLLRLLDDHWPADPEHQNHDPALAAPEARSYADRSPAFARGHSF